MKINRLSKDINRIFFLLTIFCLPFAAQAQIEEIVVTAQKREQSINDVGITLNAFSAEQLKNYGVKSADDLETLVPGLTISEAAANGVPVYTIRGVGFADYTTSASSTVGIYNDGVAKPYAVMTRGTLFDIERIEVLKGPQGDLYGRNTTAGQINFITRRPTEEFTAGIELDYSRFEVIDVEGYVSGSLSDSMRARVAARLVESPENSGWQRSITRPDEKLGAQNLFGIRGTVEYDMTDRLDLTLNVHYTKDTSDNPTQTPFRPTAFAAFFLGGADPRANLTLDSRLTDWPEGFKPENDNNSTGVSLTWNWKGDNITVTSITSYDNFERDDWFDTAGVNYFDGTVNDVSEIDAVSQEFRISGNFNEDIYWLAGIYYSEDTLDEAYLFTFEDSPFAVNVDTFYTQETESIAGFGHVEWSFAEQFKLTLGARYTEEDREWSGCTFDRGDGLLAGLWNFFLTPVTILPVGLPDPGLLAPGGCGIYDEIPGSPTFGTFASFSDKIDANEWMWKASLDYSPTEDILLYGTISRGFKSGGFNGAAAQTHSQLIPYDVEKLLSYEIGMKSTWLDGRMQLNASVFFYDYEDKQEPTVAVTPVGNIAGLTNVPESEIIGAELELHWQLLDGLLWDLGVAYLDTEFTEYQAIDAGASFFGNIILTDASGFELANSPNWQVTSSLFYEFPITGTINAFVAGDVSYKDNNEGSLQADVNLNPVPSYVLLNARVGIRSADDKWRLMFWGRNITNREYFTATLPGNGVDGRMWAPPVTYGINLSYSY